jgi:hypothetical protein
MVPIQVKSRLRVPIRFSLITWIVRFSAFDPMIHSSSSREISHDLFSRILAQACALLTPAFNPRSSQKPVETDYE